VLHFADCCGAAKWAGAVSRVCGLRVADVTVREKSGFFGGKFLNDYIIDQCCSIPILNQLYVNKGENIII
jgi:hypothetical protein